MANEPKTITTDQFKLLVKRINGDITKRELCFVLGSGASHSAGIPTGGQMAEKWFNEMPEVLGQADFDHWKNKELNAEEKKWLEKKDYPQLYSSIYRKMFELDVPTGYHTLLELMRGKHPSNGHIILSRILKETRHRCVVTTNFDNLCETAIYRYTNAQPLVCGHEALAQYAKPTTDIPLVVKVHRDLLTDPKSQTEHIKKLEERWKPVLDNIFSARTPIIIGYGGNDGSLMSYFEDMAKPDNFFWCLYKNEKPSERILALVTKLGGVFICHNGFDELLRELLFAFSDVQGNLSGLETEFTQRITEFKNWMTNGEPKPDATKQIASTKKVGIKTTKELSAWEYDLKASKETDLDKAAAIYEEALAKYPTTAWLWGQTAHFYQFVKKDYSNLEKYYQKALELGLDEAWFNGNYALYLKDFKKDYDKAEEYYIKSLEAEPNSATLNNNYAVFLKVVRRDRAKEEEYLLKALRADPNHFHSNFNYALFLEKGKKNLTQAEEHYQRALVSEANDADLNCIYANFLSETKNDYAKAEEHFKRALTNDPNGFFSNGSYAVFLQRVKKELKNAEEYYLKALKGDGEDSARRNFNGNLSQLLLASGRKSEAQKHFDAAFNNGKTDDDLLLELWFYRYAHYPEYLKEAKTKMDELLAKGTRSIGWDFNPNIERAIKDKHPEPELLKEYARKITTE